VITVVEFNGAEYTHKDGVELDNKLTRMVLFLFWVLMMGRLMMSKNHKFASTSPYCLEAHAGFFKGKFDVYLL